MSTSQQSIGSPTLLAKKSTDKQVMTTTDTGLVSASPGHTSDGTGSHNWSVNLRITDLMYETAIVQAHLQKDDINLCDMKSVFVQKKV